MTSNVVIKRLSFSKFYYIPYCYTLIVGHTDGDMIKNIHDHIILHVTDHVVTGKQRWIISTSFNLMKMRVFLVRHMTTDIIINGLDTFNTVYARSLIYQNYLICNILPIPIYETRMNAEFQQIFKCEIYTLDYPIVAVQ